MKIIKLLFISIFIFFISINLNSKIKYKVSGRVVHDGKGVSNIMISIAKHIYPVYSDSSGYFNCYLPNGVYEFYIISQKGYVRIEKEITIKNKNVSNVVFVLEKGCRISGTVKFDDGSIPKGFVRIRTFDKDIKEKGLSRSSDRSEIKEDGKYMVSYITPGEDIKIFVTVWGLPTIIRKGYILNEGEELKDVNFIIPKRISILGKVIDKSTKRVLLPEEDVITMGIETEKWVYSPFISENGEFQFYNLKEGKYKISVDALNYEFKEFFIFLSENETKNIVIELEKIDQK